ncbi:hypothetical protein WICMUC_004110 [Wickerhamomyces mucosus]|uniref:N(6)-L-threonylcarbamoyladenine synthase n=1 Tax=Wickerhamomyces mucosus TaxID=1378264 RepID=A0A9P8PK02_9ASCO|nr:hypothetical protein WICMUC_004110 [Wickerhamomyces mucosus]
MLRLSKTLVGCNITKRGYKVLAIETSCDDTCVALMERDPKKDRAKLLQHVKKTLDSTGIGGIIPTKAFDHHQSQISAITREILKNNSIDAFNPPDLICVTRGPGMKGSLSIGLDFAKGLSVAYEKPLIGVHHMLGHLLMPRFNRDTNVEFPFLSLLISGGHTMLVLTKSLFEHEVLCNTIDVACGDALDKVAREIGMTGNSNLGREMDKFLKDFTPTDAFQFDLPKPLQNKRGRVNQLNFALGAFQGKVREIMENNSHLKGDSNFRKHLAFQSQLAIFNHVVTKVALTLSLNKEKLSNVKNFVCSGGVASNFTLRRLLNQSLKVNSNVENCFYPDPWLCTDNAVMIGWAGIELFEAGLVSEMTICPMSKWNINDIINVDDWQ